LSPSFKDPQVGPERLANTGIDLIRINSRDKDWKIGSRVSTWSWYQFLFRQGGAMSRIVNPAVLMSASSLSSFTWAVSGPAVTAANDPEVRGRRSTLENASHFSGHRTDHRQFAESLLRTQRVVEEGTLER
jgi:hypothetical protein